MVTVVAWSCTAYFFTGWYFRDEKKCAVRGKCDESPRRNFAVNVSRNHETTNILSQ